MSAIPLTRKITPDEARDWIEPLPLVQRQQPEPYPAGALPDPIRAIVEELQSFLQAPTALIANSVLGALSLLNKAHTQPNQLYAGSPAQAMKALDPGVL